MAEENTQNNSTSNPNNSVNQSQSQYNSNENSNASNQNAQNNASSNNQRINNSPYGSGMYSGGNQSPNYQQNTYTQNNLGGQQGYNQMGYSGQGYDPYGGYNQMGYGTTGYDPYGGYNQTGYTGQGYDPYGGYNQMGYGTTGYDPYGGYNQMGYTGQGYDPYGGYNQIGYGTTGYDPYGGYNQMGYSYDPNMYYAQDSSPTPNNPMRVNVTPNNPMRVNVTPNNPATSSNNITLNLDNLDQGGTNNNNRERKISVPNEKLKLFLAVLMENNVEIYLYSNQNDEMPIASGGVNMVTNQTVSVENKVAAIKYISYIKFSNKNISDGKIHEFFAKVNTPRQKTFQYDLVSDFYNLLYSKILLNQSVNITIDASFLVEIQNVNVINLNTEVAILKSDEFYYLIELDKIVSVE